MTELTIREPTLAELDRVIYFFRNHMLRPQAKVLVAVRRQPVERFVAAGAWWKEGEIGRFQLISQPGTGCPEAFDPLIDHVVESARSAGLPRLHYADLLTVDEPICKCLRATGFEPLGANRFFEIGSQEAWTRVMQLVEKCRADVPADWRTEPVRNHRPETVLDVIGNHRLLPATELHYYWQMNSSGGLDLDDSSILFDGAHAIGTLLTRRGPETFYIDVRVVRSESRRLRALGNLLLFLHMAKRWQPGGQIQRLQFHGGEAEHRETANLALRMGGRELPSRFVFAKTLLNLDAKESL